jgi:hypothetical protein
MGTPQDREAILAKAPAGARRALVRNELGDLKYKAIGELADTDEIQLKSDNTPITMRGKPGRKKKIAVEPANDKVAAILKKREAALSSDGVLTAARNDTEEELMGAIILALGEEQASLAYVRQELERSGKLADTASISTRRVQGLKTMADTLQKKMDRNRERSLNTDSPAFRAYFSHVMGTFKEAMAAVGSRPEMIETVFSKFAAMSSDPAWEAEARARIRSAV